MFKRSRQIVEHEERSVLIDTPSNDAWEWMSRTQEDAALKTFLESTVDDDSSSMKIIDIESKYHLHKLHKATGINRVISWSTASSIALVVLLTVAYACRNHLTCGKLPLPTISRARSIGNPVSLNY